MGGGERRESGRGKRKERREKRKERRETITKQIDVKRVVMHSTVERREEKRSGERGERREERGPSWRCRQILRR